MWGGYLSDFRSAKELFAAKLQKISESSSPYHTKITFDLTERLVENHLCCRLTHLPEVCRYRCKSVKDDIHKNPQKWGILRIRDHNKIKGSSKRGCFEDP